MNLQRAIRSALYGLAAGMMLFGDRAAAITPWFLAVNTNNIITVTDSPYNAVGDGVFTNTAAIQSAINAANAGGLVGGLRGGLVRVPSGIFLCGPLTMKNNVDLQLDPGAILRLLPYGSYPGMPYDGSTTVSNFISGSSLTNIAITGFGAIDGQGEPWWAAYSTNTRPTTIYFGSCSRVLLEGFTCSNPPAAHIAIKGNNAGNVTFQGITLKAPASSDPVLPSHNTDGVDFAETNGLFVNCVIDTGDDNIAMGSSGGLTRDVLVTNCFFGAGHGVSIGSYTSSGVSNLTVVNCAFDGTDNGFRIKSQRDRGGLVQNLNYSDVTMTNVDWPFLIYSYYEFGLGTLSPANSAYAANVASTDTVTQVTSTTPIYRNITFSNITAYANNSRPALMIWGLPQMNVSNVVFKNVTLSANRIAEIFNARGIQFIDSRLDFPAGTNGFDLFNAEVIITNSLADGTLNTFTGVSTNGWNNSLEFYNALGSMKNTNALDDGPLTLSASTFTVSNNLSLFPNNVLNYYLGTNPATLAVAGNLRLGGTNNIFAGPGFTNGTYALMTYAGALSGTLPALGNVPNGYNYQFDTNTPGTVKLVVSTTLPAPATPANLNATASDTLVSLTWFPSPTATGYNLKRSYTSGGGYVTIASLAGTNYPDTQVTNGRSCFYVVSATNAGGESADSAEASATPLAIVFNDTFSNSSLNSSTQSGPTSSGTSYELISTKTWNPTPVISAGHLKFGIAATSSGVIEVQALFASSPVTLATIGDTVSLVVTFTNASGLFTQGGPMGFGLYNSGQNYPVPGGLNATATSAYTTNTVGNAQPWVGYVGQLAFTNASSQILTRAAQTIGILSNNCQDVVSSGSGSSSYNYPAGTIVGNASSTGSVALATNSLYTDVFTIKLMAGNILVITNSLYAGADASGPLLSQFGATASGAAYLTNSFDALAIGWRAQATNSATAIDINNISVTAGVSAGSFSPPPAPTSLQASATNLLIKLDWNSVTGATTYNLKRGNTSAGPYPTVFSGLTATNYSDANVTNAATYYYVVAAVGAGGESTNSPEASAVPLPSNQAINITTQITGNQLQLSWPQDHLGWRLEMQANNLDAGLGTNWTTVPNSTNVISTNILMNPANGSVFFRLIYP